nr:lysylphosphatidylglycerol synthase transmembrane domain-containing protein [Salipiger sp. PrR002]
MALGGSASVFFIWLVLRAIPLADLLAVLRSARPVWVMLAAAAFGVGYACRIWRWRLMLISHNPELRWSRCAVPFMVSIAANNVLPFRAGDALRTVAFTNWLGVPTAKVLATMLVERLLDLLCLLVALGLAMAIFGEHTPGAVTLISWGALPLIGASCAIVLLLLFPRWLQPPTQWGLGLLHRIAPAAAKTLGVQMDKLFHTLETLARRPRIALLLLWSLLAWSFEAVVFYAIACALPEMSETAAAWVAMPVGTLSTMLPSTPGYVGTFHYFVMKAAEALGNADIAAAAFAFLVHLALYIPATLWGGFCFAYWALSGASGIPTTTTKEASS